MITIINNNIIVIIINNTPCVFLMLWPTTKQVWDKQTLPDQKSCNKQILPSSKAEDLNVLCLDSYQFSPFHWEKSRSALTTVRPTRRCVCADDPITTPTCISYHDASESFWGGSEEKQTLVLSRFFYCQGSLMLLPFQASEYCCVSSGSIIGPVYQRENILHFSARRHPSLWHFHQKWFCPHTGSWTLMPKTKYHTELKAPEKRILTE